MSIKESMVDVVIVGAGPAGLTLAAELSSRGIVCQVLEKRNERSKVSRAFSLASYTLELFDMRGIADKMCSKGVPCYIAPLSDGENYLDLKKIKSKYNYLLSIPQTETEETLEGWAKNSGASITKGANLIGLNQSDQCVDVFYESIEGQCQLRAKYVVGCDGIRSDIRSASGIQFLGQSVEKTLMHGDVYLSNPPEKKVYAKTNKYGMVATIPFDDGSYRVLIIDRDRMDIPVDKCLSVDEFNESILKIAGKDFGIKSVKWLNRFRGQQRHATHYKLNRVFLCGDAAHAQLPAGGQGLQASIQDAFNLGWKLAAVISGIASEKLLETYESERRPIIDHVMRHSLRMFHYEISNRGIPMIMKFIANKAMRIPILENWAVSQISGLNIRYKLKSNLKDRVIGTNVNTMTVKDKNGREKCLREAMRTNQAVIVVSEDQFRFCGDIVKWLNGMADVVINVDRRKKASDKNIFVRPDGIVSYVADTWTEKTVSDAIQSCYM